MTNFYAALYGLKKAARQLKQVASNNLYGSNAKPIGHLKDSTRLESLALQYGSNMRRIFSAMQLGAMVTPADIRRVLHETKDPKADLYYLDRQRVASMMERARKTGKLKILNDAFQKSNYIYSSKPSLYDRFPTYQGGTDPNSLREAGMMPRLLTSIDIETSDTDKILSTSAVRFAMDAKTHQLYYIDNLQRYYNKIRLAEVQNTYKVHQLSPRGLSRLRAQQFRAGIEKYPGVYSQAEEKILRDYIGNSVLIGENIEDFDIPRLFGRGTLANNPVVDLMTMSINKWGNSDVEGHPLSHSLEAVFQRAFGKTMEEADMQHHSSAWDTGSTALTFEQLMKMGGEIPKNVEHAFLKGYSLIEQQVYQPRGGKTQRVMLGYRGDLGHMANINGVISEEEYKDLERQIKEGTGLGQSMHVENPNNLENMGFSLTPGKEDLSSWTAAISQAVKDGMYQGLGVSMAAFFEHQENVSEGLIAARDYEKRRHIRDLGQMMARGDINDEDIQAYMDIRDPNDRRKKLYSKRDTEALLDRIKQEASLYEKRGAAHERIAYMHRYGQDDFYPGDQASAKEYQQAMWDAGFTRRKERALRSLGVVDRYNTLQEGYTIDDVRSIRGAQSIEELNDAIDDLKDKSQASAEALENVNKRWDTMNTMLRAWTVPGYDLRRLNNEFHSQFSGVMGSLSDLLPQGLSRPTKHLTSAILNAYNARYAGVNEALSAYSEIGGSLMNAGLSTAALMPGPAGKAVGAGMMGIGALVNAGTRIVGHTQHARIVQLGQQAQMALEVGNVVKDVALIPLQVLGSAIKVVSRAMLAFGGITYSASRNLQGLTAMGNPLTGMTGMSWGDYIGSSIVDKASQLGTGSINSMYNDFASQRVSLYTTGQLNSGRMIAASMLGVFDQVYGMSGDEKSNITGLVNTLAGRLTGMDDFTRKQTYALANTLSPSMGNILQTMHDLGLSRYEDFLAGPGRMRRPSAETMDAYRGKFTRASWEYQTAQANMQFQGRRIATSLWDTLGVPLANFGGTVAKLIADALEGRPIKGIKQEAKGLWDEFKEGIIRIKGVLMEVFGLDKDTKLKDLVSNGVWDLVKTGVRTLIDAIPTFAAAWNAIVDIGAQKLQGFADFLSGAQLDTKQIAKLLTPGMHPDGPLVHFYNRNIPYDQQWNGYKQRIDEHSFNEAYNALEKYGAGGFAGFIEWGRDNKVGIPTDTDAANYPGGMKALIYDNTKLRDIFLDYALSRVSPALGEGFAQRPGENRTEYLNRAKSLFGIDTYQLKDASQLLKISNSEFGGIIEALEKLANGRLNISITTEDKNTGQKKTASMGVGSISNSGGLVTNSYEAALGNMVLRAQYAVGSQ